jgi:hypothetical protein
MKAVFLLIITILLFSFSAKQKNVHLEISQERVVLAFTQSANADEIEKARIRLKNEAKIDFSFEENDDEISIKVDCKDGFKSNYSENLGNTKRLIGFYRIYTKNEKKPFGIGKISKDFIKIPQ